MKVQSTHFSPSKAPGSLFRIFKVPFRLAAKGDAGSSSPKYYFRIHSIWVGFLVCLMATLGLTKPGHSKAFPQHIVSMSPSITETLFAIGLEDRIVGVTEFCQYPEKAKMLPKVGGLLNPNAEQIISLHPDLLVYHYDSYKIARFAKQLGINTLEVSFDDLDSIFRSIQKVGDVTGNSGQARILINHLRNQISFFYDRLKTLPPRSTLLVLGDSQNPMRDLYAVGKGTFLDELLTIAGGDNIVKDSPTLYPKVSREFIIAHSPEAILVAGPKADLVEKDFKKHMREWKKLSSVRAIKNQEIHYIGADYILIPGPRLINIIDQFSKALHPNIFEKLPPSITKIPARLKP